MIDPEDDIDLGDWDRPRTPKYSCSDRMCGADDCRTCRHDFVPDTGDAAENQEQQ